MVAKNLPPLIDTHCHLDDSAYDSDRVAVLERARAAGVVALVDPGSNLAESAKAIEIAHQFENVFVSVGVHPHAAAASNLNLKDIEKKLDQFLQDPTVVALGEFGLDVKHGEENVTRQIDLARVQLGLARANAVPIVLHCRAAYQELFDLLKKEGRGVRGVLHCFAGGPAELQQALDLGLYVAYGGLITFGKKTEQILAAVKQTPLDRLLLETDAPYLTPLPRRGRRNEPAEVATVARFIADLRKIPYAELASVTTENARNLFSLPNVLEVHTATHD